MARQNANAWAKEGGAVEEDPEETRVIYCSLDSYMQYAKWAHFNVTHLRRQTFYALPQAHWKLLSALPFSYPDMLDRADEAIESNAELARAIVKFGLRSVGAVAAADDGGEPAMPAAWAGSAKSQDIDKARSTLKQFFRDWSAEGAAEREACYGIVMRAVEEQKQRIRGKGRAGGGTTKRPAEEEKGNEARQQRRQRQRQRQNGDAGAEKGETEKSGDGDGGRAPDVLVPGAGLGRLVFELCLGGCNAEGNEISYHQLLASSYVLNHTDRAGRHTIFPWVHTFSNHQTRADHLRGYAVPDVHPATALAAAPRPGVMTMCGADFLCLYGDEAHAARYDAVASVFFLDTAPNLIRYLEVMHHCLRPGGILVNLGPLQWHFENSSPGLHGSHGDDGDGTHDPANSSLGIADPGSFELANDEVMTLLEKVGFAVEWLETGLRTPYIHDAESMLHTMYRGSAWVARKPDEGGG